MIATHGDHVHRLDDTAGGQAFIGGEVGEPSVERQIPAVRWLQIASNRVETGGFAAKLPHDMAPPRRPGRWLGSTPPGPTDLPFRCSGPSSLSETGSKRTVAGVPHAVHRVNSLAVGLQPAAADELGSSTSRPPSVRASRDGGRYRLKSSFPQT